MSMNPIRGHHDPFVTSIPSDSPDIDLELEKQIQRMFLQLHKYESEQVSQEKGALQLYTPLEARSDFESPIKFDAFDKVKIFLEGLQRCLLLMGDAGAGKTTFAYYLAEHLWKAHENGFIKDKPIPILIPLITIGDAEKNLLQEHFQHRGLRFDDILFIKKKFNFVFILEGYDERGLFKNLYQSNRLDEWNCHVITTCRSQSLINRRDDYRSYFASGLHNKLEEMVLCPFTNKEIKQYIQEYVKQQQGLIEWDSALYWKTLSQLPSVLALVTNPFILKMTVLALPQLVEKYGWGQSETQDLKKPLYEKQALTQAELYDDFIAAWFERQIKKMGDKLELPTGMLLKSVDFFKYNQEIAIEMMRHKTKYLEHKDSPKQVSLLMSSTSTTSLQSDWQSPFFNPLDEKTTLLRSAWLLKKTGSHTYAFLHDSLRAHFAAKQLSHGIISHNTFGLGHPLNEELIVDQPDLLDSLVDRMNSDPHLKHLLFQLLYTSKYEPFVSIGAANAITILNRAGCVFSGQDLSFVRIAGADLSGAYLDDVDFKETDLRNVKLINASFVGGNFTGACMDGVQFGQLPPLRFEDPITDCTFSPNGQWLAVGDTEGYVSMVETATKCVVAKLKYWFLKISGENLRVNCSQVRSLAFSPDSKFLAVGHSDGCIRLWEHSSQKLIQRVDSDFMGSASCIESVVFSLDGSRLACGGSDKIIRLWRLIDGKTSSCKELYGHLGQITSLAFSPNGKIFASGSEDGTIRLLGDKEPRILFTPISDRPITQSLASIRTVQYINKMIKFVNHELDISDEININDDRDVTDEEILRRDLESKPICRIAFSPDSNLLASTSPHLQDATVRLWELSKEEEARTLQGHTGLVRTVDFSCNGKTLASGGDDKIIRIWDVYSGNLIQTLQGHTASISRVKFSPDSKTLATASLDRTVRFWETTHLKAFHTYEGHASEVCSVAVSHDATTIASGSTDKTIRLRDAATGKMVRILEGHTAFVSTISFSPDDRLLASSSWDNNIHLWERSTGKLLHTLRGHTDAVHHIDFSSDGKLLASGSKDTTVRLWRVESGVQISATSMDSEVTSIAISPDGEFFASGALLQARSVTTGQVLWRKPKDVGVHSVTFSPRGKFLASGNGDNTIWLLHAVNGAVFERFHGHQDHVTNVAFSPDGRLLASASWDRTVRLWSLNGECHSVYKEFNDYINSIAWNPKSAELITGDASGAVKRFLFNKNLKKPPRLIWSSHGTQGLHADQATITLVTGLSKDNLSLLQLLGAVGQPSQKSSNDILVARDEMETVGETCNTVFGRLPGNELYSITPAHWVVSLAHKKENEHAFIILEGIENKKRVIYQAEVFLDYQRTTHEFKIPLFGNLGFGHAYIQIKPISTRRAEELAKQVHLRSEAINMEQADKLMKLIKKKAQSELLYNNLGNSKIYAIAMGTKEYGNCLTFIEEWLNEIKVNFVQEAGWQETLSPFSITSQRKYFLPDDKTDSTSGCNIQ